MRPEKKRREKSFSIKYQIENISSFVGYKNSLHNYSVLLSRAKVARGTINKAGICFPTKVYF